MLTGESLSFNQQDIIQQQHQRRLKSHPEVPNTTPDFQENDIVFCNSEKNKLKTRDQLIVREKLDNGMYRLDRLKQNSGKITKAFLPGRDLYKPTTFKAEEKEPTLETESSENDALPEVLGQPQPQECDLSDQNNSKNHPHKQQQDKSNQSQQLTQALFERVPPAQGHGHTYILPYPREQIFLPFALPGLYTSQEAVSKPSLAPINNLHEQDEDIENNLNESTSTYESVEEDSNAAPELQNLPNSPGIQQHEPSTASDEGNSSIIPSPVRRYPSRKRNVPCSFQYEEIVKKKPK